MHYQNLLELSPLLDKSETLIIFTTMHEMYIVMLELQGGKLIIGILCQNKQHRQLYTSTFLKEGTWGHLMTIKDNVPPFGSERGGGVKDYI